MAQHPPQLDSALPPDVVYGRLDGQVRGLISAVRTLYAGSWVNCAEDLRRRRAGRPYLFRLDLGLTDELGWVHRLATYEAARGERFADTLPLENFR